MPQAPIWRRLRASQPHRPTTAAAAPAATTLTRRRAHPPPRSPAAALTRRHAHLRRALSCVSVPPIHAARRCRQLLGSVGRAASARRPFRRRRQPLCDPRRQGGAPPRRLPLSPAAAPRPEALPSPSASRSLARSLLRPAQLVARASLTSRPLPAPRSPHPPPWQVAADGSTRLVRACRSDDVRHSDNMWPIAQFLADALPDPKPYEGLPPSRRGVRRAADGKRVTDWCGAPDALTPRLQRRKQLAGAAALSPWPSGCPAHTAPPPSQHADSEGACASRVTRRATPTHRRWQRRHSPPPAPNSTLPPPRTPSPIHPRPSPQHTWRLARPRASLPPIRHASAAQVAPRLLPGCSQVAPRLLPGCSQVAHGLPLASAAQVAALWWRHAPGDGAVLQRSALPHPLPLGP